MSVCSSTVEGSNEDEAPVIAVALPPPRSSSVGAAPVSEHVEDKAFTGLNCAMGSEVFSVRLCLTSLAEGEDDRSVDLTSPMGIDVVSGCVPPTG